MAICTSCVMRIQFRNIAKTSQAFHRAPHVPFSGASKIRIDQLFLDDIAALHVMDVLSGNSAVPPLRSENALGAWGAFSGLRVGIFGPTKRIRTDESGEWKSKA